MTHHGSFSQRLKLSDYMKIVCLHSSEFINPCLKQIFIEYLFKMTQFSKSVFCCRAAAHGLTFTSSPAFCITSPLKWFSNELQRCRVILLNLFESNSSPADALIINQRNRKCSSVTWTIKGENITSSRDVKASLRTEDVWVKIREHLRPVMSLLGQI